MAAVAYPMAERRAPARRRLVVVAPGRAPHRPAAGTKPSVAVYRRRRAVTLAGLVLAAVVVGLVLQAALAGLGGGPLTAAGTSGAGGGGLQPAAVTIHVVQPGDTVWSIVRQAGVKGDPRPAVDRIEAQLHGRPLQIGQRLVLP